VQLNNKPNNKTIMKKLFLFAICSVFALVSQAQTNTDELRYLQDIIGIKKQQYVEEHIKISQADAAKFWAIYNEYDLYRSEIGEKRVHNISEYAKYYNNLTNEKAEQLIQSSFTLTNDMDKLLQKTYTTMAKEISPVTAAQFVLVELYLDALVRKAVTEQIPIMVQSGKK
jgi:hypothetical protein